MAGFQRLEPLLLGLFLACWTVALLPLVGLVPLAGNLPLGLYPYYTVAAVLGWLAGNLWVQRGKDMPAAMRRRLLLIYFVGPPGVLYLIRAMAPAADQMAAPLVPFYGLGVYSVLFLVPVTLRGTTPPRPRPPRIGG